MEQDLKEITSRIRTFTLALYFLIALYLPLLPRKDENQTNSDFSRINKVLFHSRQYYILDLIPLDLIPLGLIPLDLIPF